MKTLKTLAALVMLAPVLVILVEAGVTLLPCQRHSELRREVYQAIRNDVQSLLS